MPLVELHINIRHCITSIHKLPIQRVHQTAKIGVHAVSVMLFDTIDVAAVVQARPQFEFIDITGSVEPEYRRCSGRPVDNSNLNVSADLT